MVNDSDVMLVRQGLTDFQAEVSKVRAIDISAYSALIDPQPTDLFMVQRASTTYSMRFDKVGFVAGTRLWFHQNTAPSGWQIVPGLGDRLLAVAGGTTYSTGGTAAGTWQQPGAELTINQIPNHTHHFWFGSDQSNEKSVYAHGARNQRPRQQITLGVDGSNRPLNGTGESHNHGNTYRPLANVGIICQKLT